ncbi:PAS domain S-box protein [Chitinibacter fontanus]|uniref:histidine kinase n=1 Tax=Chitinibacter fontanus TaxID=1737446 RepID=A0A7D5ZC33_9NEIS|nr:PAS domain-containing sensor histidine kinase [Chitinibacter fontanus]QLI81046.1 PAS domain S-box protein [Chitinibacter fontanus]
MLKPHSRVKPLESRWLLTLPSFAAALFSLALAVFLIFTAYSEQSARNHSLMQDLLWQKQALNTRVDNFTHQLRTVAASMATDGLGSAEFTARTLSLLEDSPEIISLEYIDETGQQRWREPATKPANVPDFRHPNLVAIREAVLQGETSSYSKLILESPETPILAIAVPIKLNYNGRHVLIAQLNLRTMLQQQVPWWIAQRYQISLWDKQKLIAGKFDRSYDASQLSSSIDLDWPPNKLVLTAHIYEQKRNNWQTALTIVVAALSILMLASTWALRRHIKERQKTEAQLRQEQALRESMENSLVTGIRAMDLQGRLFYVNRAFCEMVGYSQEKLIGASHPMPYWPPEDIEQCMAIYRAILSGRADTTGYQMRFMRSNGERFDVRLYAAKLIDGDGVHTGWISAIYDITELQREREALQASHERFVAVLNGLDAAVSVTDANSGELLLSNRHFDAAFNIPERHGRYCNIPFVRRSKGAPVDSEWFDDYNQHWYQVKSRSSIWVDGSEVWLEIATDITMLKNAQENERQQKEQLQQTTRLISMGEMASSLAHELNQPLAAIASYATGCRNVLAQTQPNIAQLDQAIEKMAAQAKRAGQIIRGIREFVQRRAPHRKQCEIADLLDTVQTLLSAEIKKAQVKLTISDTQALPPIYADAVMLEQVIFNLMKNAIEAMADTPVKQRTLDVKVRRDEEMLAVSITDRGPGINAEQMEQLFKPFYTTKGSGMGMGLNICRSIIEHHQGRLWVEANPLGGSCFHFTLPLSIESEAYEP